MTAAHGATAVVFTQKHSIDLALLSVQFMRPRSRAARIELLSDPHRDFYNLYACTAASELLEVLARSGSATFYVKTYGSAQDS